MARKRTGKLTKEDRAQVRRELREWRRRFVNVEIQFRGAKNQYSLEDKLVKLAKKAGFREENTGLWLESGIRELAFFKKDTGEATAWRLRRDLAKCCKASGAKCHFETTVQA